MKTAFVFTGCGALGAFQAAAVDVLAQRGIVPSLVYGVSSGAVNAILYSFLGSRENVLFWRGLRKFSDAFELNLWNLLFKQGDGIFRHGEKMAQLMLSKFTDRTFCRVDQCSVWVIDAEDGSLIRRRYTSGMTRNLAILAPYNVAMAACAVPGMCQNWMGFVDAGTRVLAPLKAAIQDGAEEIYVISGRVPFEDDPRKMFWPRAAAAGYYAVDSALGEILRRDLEDLEQKNEMAKMTRIAEGRTHGASGFGRVRSFPDLKEIKVHTIQPGRVLGGPTDFERCNEFADAGVVVGANF